MKEPESIRLLTKAIPFRLSLIENSVNREAAIVSAGVIREMIEKICEMEGIQQQNKDKK